MLATALAVIVLTAPPTPAERRAVRAMDAAEYELRRLDLDGPNVRFELFRSWEGGSMMAKVYRKSRPGEPGKWLKVGVIKTEGGNTLPEGEVAVYRLGRFLGVHLFPVTIPGTLRGRGIRRLEVLLDRVKYNSPYKEERRQLVLDRLRWHRRSRKPFEVSLKQWVRGLQYLPSKGPGGLPGEWKAWEHLGANGTPPTAARAVLRYRGWKTEQAEYRGSSRLDLLLRDLSNLVLVDSATCQSDRWSGQNLHFRARSGRFRRGRDGVYHGGPARLFALDNAATFRVRGAGGEALGRLYRFDRRTVERLRELAERVRTDSAGLGQWLLLDKAQVRRFGECLDATLTVVAERTKGREDRWLVVQDPPPPKRGGRRHERKHPGKPPARRSR